MSRTSQASAGHVRKLVGLQKAFVRIAKAKSLKIAKLDEQISRHSRVVENMRGHREAELGAWQNAKSRIAHLEQEILLARGGVK